MLQKETQLAVEKGEMLPLMEEFYTIQGEGYHTGTAAYFIRIGGCDVGCHWCDVKESWNAELHPPTNTDLIVCQVSIFDPNPRYKLDSGAYSTSCKVWITATRFLFNSSRVIVVCPILCVIHAHPVYKRLSDYATRVD